MGIAVDDIGSQPGGGAIGLARLPEQFGNNSDEWRQRRDRNNIAILSFSDIEQRRSQQPAASDHRHFWFAKLALSWSEVANEQLACYWYE
jgi:hypothetical protein